MANNRTKASASVQLIIAGLPLTLTRKRVRRINLRVQRDGSIAVSAPAHVSQAEIESFVRSRLTWIEQARHRVMEASQLQELRFVEGAHLRLWGETLTIHMEPHPTQGRWPRCIFTRKGALLLASVDERLAGDDEEAVAARTKQLEAWVTDQLKDVIENLLGPCEQTVGKHCQSWRLRHMTSRWGSCNVRRATITLSTELTHYPERCVRYVLIHELCHLHEPSHNARFHALMDRFCPSWREDRALLNGQADLPPGV